MSNRDCPDCKVAMVPIKLLLSQLSGNPVTLYYAPLHETRRFWTGTFPDPGVVSAWKCAECGLVRFYADSPRDVLPRPAGAPEPDRETLPRPAGPDESSG